MCAGCLTLAGLYCASNSTAMLQVVPKKEVSILLAFCLQHQIQMKLYRNCLLLQTIYYGTTALWPLVHIESFMQVTGPKTDIWLVKTVAVLLLAITASFIAALRYKSYHAPTVILAVTCCIALIFVDCVYVFNGTISKVYLADAIAELAFLGVWAIIILRKIRSSEGHF